MTSPDDAPPAIEARKTRGSSMARSTAVMTAGTLVSRALGMVRTMLLIAAIGVTGSIAADAYSVANKLPNVMFAVLAAGVLNSALVPQIVKAFHEDRVRTVHRILTVGIVGIVAVTAILTVTAGLWVRLYATNEWTPEQVALSTAFAVWCIPQLLFYGLYTLFGQVLNAREQFGPFMWAPVANNVVAIAGLVAYLVIFGSHPDDGNASVTAIVDQWDTPRILLIAAVATLGIAVQALVLIPFMARGGYRWRWVWRGPKGELGTAAKVASWALAAVAIEQVGVWLTTKVTTAAPAAAGASGAGGTHLADTAIGGAAAYDAALAIYLVPHSLITISLMTVLFTQMSRHAAAGQLARLREVMSEGVRIVAVLTLFASAVMVVTSPHLVRVLAFSVDGESVEAVAWVVAIMSLGLAPLGASVLVKQAYFALEDGRTVFLIHIPMTVAWLAVAYSVRATMDPVWWVRGVAFGLVATNVVAVVLRLWGLNRRLGGVDLRRILVTSGKALVAVLIAGAAGGTLVAVGPHSWTGSGVGAISTSLGMTLAVALLMLVIFAVMVRVLRLEEATSAARTLSRRMRRVR